MRSESGKRNAARHRSPSDRKRCSPLRPARRVDTFGATVKARHGNFQPMCPVVSPPPADSAASLFHRLRTALAHPPIPVCLPQQIGRARSSTRASRCWRPTRHRRSSRRSNEHVACIAASACGQLVHQTTRICCAAASFDRAHALALLQQEILQ